MRKGNRQQLQRPLMTGPFVAASGVNMSWRDAFHALFFSLKAGPAGFQDRMILRKIFKHQEHFRLLELVKRHIR